MPYHVGTSQECPASEPHAVIKDDDGQVMGCHATVESAQRQIAAIRASEGEAVTQAVPLPVTPTVTGESYSSMNGTPWEGVLVVEGIETGDGRKFSENALTWPDPMNTVIPLQRNIEESHGGETQTTAVLVGRITRIWRDAEDPRVIRGAGVFDDNGENGAEALRLVSEGFLRGISVDPDSIKDADVELIFPEGDGSEEDELMMMFAAPELMVFHAGRLRAATLVNIPAFVEAQIWLVDPATADDAKQVAPDGAVATSTRPWNVGATTTLAHRVAFSTVRDAYAVRGNSHLTSRFLHHELGEHGVVGPASVAACQAAIRALSSQRAKSLSYSERREAYEHLAAHLREAGVEVPSFVDEDVPQSALTAALESLEGPPLEWFRTPEPGSYQAPVVTDEVTASGWRRFYGHGAAWNTCHTGFANVCREPPREGDHPYFRLGEVVTASGERVAVGSVTMGIGHASTAPGVTARQAAEHYDNTGAVVALVASSDGNHGIWLAGAVPPWVSKERVAALQASGQLSGDWRKIGGKFRLMAFLAVNHPGFPVPRLRVGMQRGEQTSLVAAGLRPDPSHVSPGTLAAMRRIATSIGRDPASRAAEIRRRVKGS